MFTGIIETTANLINATKKENNIIFTFNSNISKELKIDQSVSHNGVCLTIVQQDKVSHQVVAVEESLKKTNLSQLKIGDTVNLERCMLINSRFDGHIVQGHIDQTATIQNITDNKGSWIFDFQCLNETNLIVEKGSITINGVSLTCFNVKETTFSVAIIPYTYEHTNFKHLKVNDKVNIEFDIIGKYVKRMLASREFH